MLRRFFYIMGMISLVALVFQGGVIHTAQGSTTTQLSGTFRVLWGDGSAQDPGSSQIYFLTTLDGLAIRLMIIEGDLDWLSLNGQPVRAYGSWVQPPTGVGNLPVFQVESLVLDLQAGGQAGPEDIIGPQPWVSILCKFSDVPAEPKNLAYFQGMYSANYPGLDHFWQEQSYGLANLEGSAAFGWFTLPKPRDYYLPGGNLDWWTAAAECTAAADAAVDFSPYVGINLMFNDTLDCCAWGGTWYACLDGVCKNWRTTWEPPWGYENIGVIGHETGHGFGLPHSSGDYGQTYDNQWDVMSDVWSNGNRGGTHPTYGTMGQHTISYHKEILGWIDDDQTVTIPIGFQRTVKLERLALPQTDNTLGAVVPIDTYGNHFITVEARQLTGYDAWLPRQTGWNQAVIIHDVLVSRDNPAHVVDVDGNGNTGDAGAIFLPGELYTSPDGIIVTVVSATSTGFVVNINNRHSSSLELSGSAGGSVGVTHEYLAEIVSTGVTLPITYRWEATGQPVITHTTGLTDTLPYTWDLPGLQFITVTAMTEDLELVDNMTVDIDIAPSGVELSGPTSGPVGISLAFTAVVTSMESTLPITYTWRVDDQVVLTQTGGLTTTAHLVFDTLGMHTVQVASANSAGKVTAEWQIAITMRTYLPFVIRQ